MIFSKQAFLKLKYFTQGADSEISGLGTSEIISPTLILITDIFIFPQVSSLAGTVLDEEALAKFLYKKTKKNEDVSKINVWFHTHSSFSVFWSLTDEHTIETTTSNNYMISIVANNKLEILGRLDVYKPLRLSIPMTVETVSTIQNNLKLKELCLREIKQKVKSPKLIPWTSKDKKTSLILTSSKTHFPSLEEEIQDRIVPLH